MITTIVTLREAANRWRAAGRDPQLLDAAVTVLDAATTNSDVFNLLNGPRYIIRTLRGADEDRRQAYSIYADGELLLQYELTEVPPDADVEILA